MLIHHENNGYYLNSGTCNKCQESCYTCTNATQCTSCQNLMLNSTTLLCEFCPDGKFYSSTLNSCVDCAGSCLEGCSYQLNCFKCTSPQIFDLDTMKCVSSCSQNQIQINDTQVHNLNICRTPNYYIDPDSTQIVELGTKIYPFKKINLAFMEILNFISHKNKSITINLKENSVNTMGNSQNYLIDAGNIKIQSYSLINSDNPGIASIYVTDSTVSYVSSKTKFNIISDFTLKLSTALNNASYTTRESQIPSYTKAAIIVDRSSLTINNINIYRDVNVDSSLKIVFIFAFYLQSNTLTISNCSFFISGWILLSEDPMNLVFQNIFIDFYSMNGGLYINTDCNYPEASITNSVLLSNITVQNLQNRIAKLATGLFSYTGAANVTVQNVNSFVFGTKTDNVNIINIEYSPNCVPQDSVPQNFVIQNNYLSLPTNTDLSSFTEVYFDLRPGKCSRQLTLSYLNNTHGNIVQNLYQNLVIYGIPTLNVVFANNMFTNFSGQYGVVMIDGANSISITNSSFDGGSNIGGPLFLLSEFASSSLSNVIINNVSISTATITHFLYFNVTENGIISIDSLTFTGSSLGMQSGIKVDGLSKSFKITNSNFVDINIGTNSEIISTGTYKSIEFSNLAFVRINSQAASDYGNYAISLDVYELCGMMNSTVKNIIMSDSNISFMYINNVVGQTNVPIFLNMLNLTIADSSNISKRSLFTVSNIVIQQNFNINIMKLYFNSISFASEGLLMYFCHQLFQPITISDLSVSGIENGGILIEAGDNMALQFDSKVTILNSNFKEIMSEITSLFILQEGANLKIYNSIFYGIACLCEGAVMSAGFQNTKSEFHFTSFENLFAIKGSALFISEGSNSKLYNCSISKNLATSGGIIYVKNNGNFEIYGSIISHNYGNAITSISYTSTPSIISGSLIFSNEILDLTSVQNELGCQCQSLCHIPASIKIFVLSNNLYPSNPSPYIIQIIQGSLKIQDNTLISGQNSFITSYMSQVVLDFTFFDNITLSFSCIRMTAMSTITITNSYMSRISGDGDQVFLLVDGGTTVAVKNTTYTKATVPFLRAQQSTITADGLNAINVQKRLPTIRISECTQVGLANLKLTDVIGTLKSSASLLIDKSQVNSMVNMTISKTMLNTELFDGGQIAIQASKINLIDRLSISNSTQSLTVTDSSITNITNSVFMSNGNMQIASSTFQFINSNTSITNSKFTYNKAKEGGAINFMCTKYCSMMISNSEFQSNSAEVGGAIKYSLYRPQMNNVTFLNNSANYGPNIASYPIKVGINNITDSTITLNNVASGQIYSSSLYMTLLDYDLQKIKINNTRDILITPATSNATIKGNFIKTISDGSLVMDGVVFSAIPGSKQMRYNLTTDQIDDQRTLMAYGTNFTTPTISANFRFCMPGEYISNNTCLTCQNGMYNLMWNSTKCTQCMDNANCLGNSTISVDQGYWRKSVNSSSIKLCPFKDSCLGGFNSNSTYPVNCKTGYQGILCAQCSTVNDDSYERVNNLYCVKCGHYFFYVLRLIAILTSYVCIIIYISNLIHNNDSNKLLFARILINYAQITTLIITYNTSFPYIIYVIFSPLQLLGFGARTAFLMDCFTSSSEANIFDSSPTITTIFMVLLLPIILVIILIITYVVLKIIRRNRIKRIKDRAKSLLVIILFILYLSQTESVFSLLSCTEIDNGDMRSTVNLNSECYSSDHIKYAAGIGAPILCFWVIGYPLLSYITLSINKMQFDKQRVKDTFSIIYVGLKNKKFFWEFINFIQKFIIVAIYVFIPYDNSSYRGMSTIIVLYIFFKIRKLLKPYKVEIYNELENASVRCIAFTIFAGIFFITADTTAFWVEVIVIIFTILVNLHFFVFLFYLHLSTYEDSKKTNKLKTFLKTLLLRNKDEDFNEPKEELSFKVIPPAISKAGLSKAKEVMKTSKLKQTSNVTSLRGHAREKDQMIEPQIPLINSKTADKDRYNRPDRGINEFEEEKDGIESRNTFDNSLPQIIAQNKKNFKKNHLNERIVEEDEYSVHEEEEDEDEYE